MGFTTSADFEARLRERLDPLDGSGPLRRRGDDGFDPNEDVKLTSAAVLAPIVRRPEGWTVMFTQRTDTMPTHAGQVSFPGGRVQAEDSGPVATALRETVEEVGIDPGFIRPIGRYDRYRTGSNYLIDPVVAYLEEGFTIAPDPREVADVFEVPAAFLFNPLNHEVRQRERNGQIRTFYAMPFGERLIWGATGNLVRALYERLYW
jgi:8-oxo-dGTP pyrophosphatase MutT (NUDIX family)